MEYAEVPSAVTARAGECRGSRGIHPKTAAAPAAAVPWMKRRLDNSDLAVPGWLAAVPGWLFTAWSSHTGYPPIGSPLIGGPLPAVQSSYWP
jgi:hypothetical protein